MNPEEVQGLLDAVKECQTVAEGYNTFVDVLHDKYVAVQAELQATISNLAISQADKRVLQEALDKFSGVTEQLKATSASMAENIIANTDAAPAGDEGSEG